MNAVQLPLPTGADLKADAMAVLERKYSTWLDRARETARTHCRKHGTVTIEDVTANLTDDPAPHPNVKGAVFKGNEWEMVTRQSAKHVAAHGRPIILWRLRQ